MGTVDTCEHGHSGHMWKMGTVDNVLTLWVRMNLKHEGKTYILLCIDLIFY